MALLSIKTEDLTAVTLHVKENRREDRLYAADSQGYIKAYDTFVGREMWSSNLNSLGLRSQRIFGVQRIEVVEPAKTKLDGILMGMWTGNRDNTAENGQYLYVLRDNYTPWHREGAKEVEQFLIDLDAEEPSLLKNTDGNNTGSLLGNQISDTFSEWAPEKVILPDEYE